MTARPVNRYLNTAGNEGKQLAMSSVHPKVVQTVMRHSTITLTTDTYGHLFPGQEAEAVGKMEPLLGCTRTAFSTDLEATGQRQGQRAQRDVQHSDATECDNSDSSTFTRTDPNRLAENGLCEVVRRDSKESEIRAARTRTGNQRIMSPLL
jgi:hypothetical protein